MGHVMDLVGLSRRDVLNVSALGAAALTLPFERAVRAKTALTITQKMANAEIPPGIQTPIFGYNGIAPGPTILARRARR